MPRGSIICQLLDSLVIWIFIPDIAYEALCCRVPALKVLPCNGHQSRHDNVRGYNLNIFLCDVAYTLILDPMTLSAQSMIITAVASLHDMVKCLMLATR